MAATTNKVAVPDPDTEDERPVCSFGPALKFTRSQGDKDSGRAFYACSATRDRKVCPLFTWCDDHRRKVRRNKDKAVSVPSMAHRETKLTDNTTNAQYFFAPESLSVLCNTIEKSTIGKKGSVLCLGTPSVFSELRKRNVEAVLLDLDMSLKKKHEGRVFRYNMMNHFFMNEEDRTNFEKYKNEKPFSAVVMDPPFHPELLDCIRRSLSKLLCKKIGSSRENVEEGKNYPGKEDRPLGKGVNAQDPKIEIDSLFIAFPYYFSKLIKKYFRADMCDFRVTYTNHPRFKTPKNTPVRFYALNVSAFDLSEVKSASYKKCNKCNLWVMRCNVHCEACNACTTVSGDKPYEHCKKCASCHKPGKPHKCLEKAGGKRKR